MHKIAKSIIAMTACFIAVGCGVGDKNNVELSGATYTLQIPIEDTKLLNMSVPEECSVDMCDNFTYWQLRGNTTITLTTAVNHLPTDSTEVPGLYENIKTVSYDYGDKTITVRCDESLHDAFKSSLMNSSVINTEVDAPSIVRLDKYPKHTTTKMQLYDNNLYMPDGAQETKLDIYTALLHINGSDFLLSWICDGKREDVQKRLINICIANSGNETLSAWYADDELFYAQTGTNIVGMKKLRANEWYIYSGTTPYRDYILTGLLTVHGGN